MHAYLLADVHIHVEIPVSYAHAYAYAIRNSSVWMVSSLGVPRPQRIATISAQPQVVKEQSRQSGEDSWMEGDDSGGDGEDEEETADVQAVPLNNPEGVCVDRDGIVYVTDTIRSCVRKMTSQGKVLRFAGADVPGYEDGALEQARFRHPRGVCVLHQPISRDDKSRAGAVLVVCDTENHCVRIISGECVATLAGCAEEGGYRDGPASQALFDMPWAACAVEDGTAVLVCDYKNHCIRKVTVDSDHQGVVVSTVFGKPQQAGDACDQLRNPWSICQVRDSIVIGDKLNQRVVMFDLSQSTSSTVLSSLWPDSMRFAPRGMASDGSSLYLSDSWQSQIWRVQRDMSTTGELRLLERIAGTGLPDHRVRACKASCACLVFCVHACRHAHIQTPWLATYIHRTARATFASSSAQQAWPWTVLGVFILPTTGITACANAEKCARTRFGSSWPSSCSL